MNQPKMWHGQGKQWQGRGKQKGMMAILLVPLAIVAGLAVMTMRRKSQKTDGETADKDEG